MIKSKDELKKHINDLIEISILNLFNIHEDDCGNIPNVELREFLCREVAETQIRTTEIIDEYFNFNPQNIPDEVLAKFKTMENIVKGQSEELSILKQDYNNLSAKHSKLYEESMKNNIELKEIKEIINEEGSEYGKKIINFTNELRSSQVDLPEYANKVIMDNLWEL